MGSRSRATRNDGGENGRRLPFWDSLHHGDRHGCGTRSTDGDELLAEQSIGMGKRGLWRILQSPSTHGKRNDFNFCTFVYKSGLPQNLAGVQNKGEGESSNTHKRRISAFAEFCKGCQHTRRDCQSRWRFPREHPQGREHQHPANFCGMFKWNPLAKMCRNLHKLSFWRILQRLSTRETRARGAIWDFAKFGRVSAGRWHGWARPDSLAG